MKGYICCNAVFVCQRTITGLNPPLPLSKRRFIHPVGGAQNFSVLFDVLGGIHTKQLVELRSEVLGIVDAHLKSCFIDIQLGIDKEFGCFAQTDKPDKGVDGLA